MGDLTIEVVPCDGGYAVAIGTWVWMRLSYLPMAQKVARDDRALILATYAQATARAKRCPDGGRL